MIFTLFYMYSTFVQWWRLGSLRNKINGTLNSSNALMICGGDAISEPRHRRCLENLLFHRADRIGCTVVPRQMVNLGQWVSFPQDMVYFPIYFGYGKLNLVPPQMFVLVQAYLENYSPHEAELIEIEKFGELVAWRVSGYLEVILRTDLEHVTKLVHCFSNGDIDINHDLKLVRVETVDVEGRATSIRYERVFSVEQKVRYSCGEVHWRKFVANVKELYGKIYELSSANCSPKITIEAGPKPDDGKKVPVSEVRPIKKETKTDLETNDEERNTLAVHASRKSEHHFKGDRRRGSGDKIKEVKVEARRGREQASRPVKEGKEEERRDSSDKTKQQRREARPAQKNEPNAQATAKQARTHGAAPKTPRTQEQYADKVKLGEAKAKEGKAKVSPKRKNTPTTTGQQTRSVDGACATPARKCGAAEVDGRAIGASTDTVFEDCRSFGSPVKATSQTLTTSRSSLFGLDEFVSLEDIAAPKESAARTDLANDVLLGVFSKDGMGGSPSESKFARNQDRIPASSARRKHHGAHTFKVGSIIQERNVLFPELGGPRRTAKPPNVLVYADSVVARENVKGVLHAILNKEKYTVYDLPANRAANFWDESTTLVVVCGNVTPTLTNDLLQYLLLTGGQLLCLCSDLLYSVLQTFSTAEVREHELVRFSYGDWKRVKMMHHIFCYQASPAKKQFSKDSDQSNHSGDGSSPVAPRTPSAVDIQHNGRNYTIQVQVLGTEETWQTPSLLLASVKGGEGRAIFSQVHLEIDPTQYQDDESKYAALTDSNQARLEILKHILSTHLDTDCTNKTDEINYTYAYFLGRHDMKVRMLTECESIRNNKLENEEVTLVFCGKDVEPGGATSTRLPVLVLSCPTNFSTVQYFETLQTRDVGRLVIYADVLTSSQLVLSHKLHHGLAVIPRQQTRGVGRSSNAWLSPPGCAMFSLQLHVPTKSALGRSLPLVQHLVMVAVVSALRGIPGYEQIDIGLKWPNDLYAYSKVKIGGLVVASKILSNLAIVNVGCGVNLDNSNPTTCVNDVIRKHNEEHGVQLPAIAYEKFFALVFNELERILDVVQDGDVDFLFDMYYKYWLHSGAEISVVTKEGETRKVEVVGVDDFGYLTVRSPDGSVSGVQPDGNTFDMLKGLIAPKIN